jgi:hypothetical protein
MTRAQRVGFVALALAALVVAFAVLRPADDNQRRSTGDRSSTTPSMTTEPQEQSSASDQAPAAREDAGPLLVRGRVQRIEVREGGRVRLLARSAQADELHVHGYDILRDLRPGRTLELSFEATIEGSSRSSSRSPQPRSQAWW